MKQASIINHKGDTMRRMKGRKAQSVTEYAILLGVAIAVFAGMQTYVKRGFNAKIKKGTDAMTSAGANKRIDFDGGDNMTMGKLDQYEPYYSTSSGDSYSENRATENLQGGQITKTNNDLNVQSAGSTSGTLVGTGNSETKWNNVN